MANDRVTQVVAEAVIGGATSGTARITQVDAEVVIGGDTGAKARITQVVMEVVIENLAVGGGTRVQAVIIAGV